MKHLSSLLLIVALAACTDASQARFDSYGSKFKVEVLSGGQVVRTYTSTGKLGRAGEGYYFNDAATGKYVQVNADVIITQLD
ncbi:hypothetical protein MUN82_02525 [Hymenobacter aerilatus]|uniref:Uncharacterized protein n=1 Tax=Hymenobacter aerilatus TaxID=2932251 RepID=A0A8T9SW67_9BACT|nr:hypothetical protein [Hymenobacter aerilatus]UOR05987.1 hypothetical protein MUN82_02525 [Hymenobacter aerilatus]